MSDFWLGMVTTLSGVIVSFTLVVLVAYLKSRNEAGLIRETLVNELRNNQSCLEEHNRWFREFIDEAESLINSPPDANKLPSVVPGRMRTGACDSALSSGRLHLIRDTALEASLVDLSVDYRFYNHMLDSHEDFVIRNFAVSCQSPVQWQWLIERISKAFKLAMLYIEKYSETNSDLVNRLNRSRGLSVKFLSVYKIIINRFYTL